MMKIEVTLDVADPRQAKALSDFATALAGAKSNNPPKLKEKTEIEIDLAPAETVVEEEPAIGARANFEINLEKAEAAVEETEAAVEETEAVLEETVSEEKKKRKPSKRQRLLSAIQEAETEMAVVDIVDGEKDQRVLSTASKKIDAIRLAREQDTDGEPYLEETKLLAENEKQRENDIEDKARVEATKVQDENAVAEGKAVPELKVIRVVLNSLVPTHRNELKDKLNELGASNLSKLDSSKHLEFYNFMETLKNE